MEGRLGRESTRWRRGGCSRIEWRSSGRSVARRIQCLRREGREAGKWKTAVLGMEVQPQEEVVGRPGPLQWVQKG